MMGKLQEIQRTLYLIGDGLLAMLDCVLGIVVGYWGWQNIHWLFRKMRMDSVR